MSNFVQPKDEFKYLILVLLYIIKQWGYCPQFYVPLGSLTLRILLCFLNLHNHSLERAFLLSSFFFFFLTYSLLRQKISQISGGKLRGGEIGKRQGIKYVTKKPKHLSLWLINCHLENWVEDNCLHYFSR